MIPVIALVQTLFSLAVAIFVSAANVFYRDIGNLARHVLRFWFYLSPGLYGLDEVAKLSGKNAVAEAWFMLNPFSHLLASYRSVIYYGQAPDWAGLLGVALVSLLLIALAVLFFKRVEPSFAKVL
jgi:ABC-type polysaccharide/polyol phosphate export permease